MQLNMINYFLLAKYCFRVLIVYILSGVYLKWNIQNNVNCISFPKEYLCACYNYTNFGHRLIFILFCTILRNVKDNKNSIRCIKAVYK